MSDYPLTHIIPRHHVREKPEKVAQKVREKFYPKEKCNSDRDFLKALINKLGEQNIIVFEFVENWNLKHKSSIDGFFIAPNIISIKRQQDSLKREIFTLVHELGHYLLNQEELDQPVVGQHSESKNETWCNSFAFDFLVGPYKSQLLEMSSTLVYKNLS